MTIRSAMVLAAGLGTRMRPITERIPKPLVEVDGKPLIAYGLEALGSAGLDTIVVNVHYLADKLEAWLSDSGYAVTIADERAELLDSGGGIVNALAELGSEPFVVINADTFWLEDPQATAENITRLIEIWNPAEMDIALMTARPDQATGFDGKGDFVADDSGRLQRYRGEGDPLIYAGALVIDPAIFGTGRPAKFSLNACFNEAIERRRLHGMPMAGLWLTVGTPEAIGEAEAAMHAYRSGNAP
ncbi:nucleotidyltransferase family protein [Pseudohoeflea suaedae]|uniref:Nucleotidyltransferase family protein n=1 Tax=Pseudohoeflea suaedae TaxID=877384 RepID=A0A4R5PMW9_9HYPH|nr:nucleotidyltransferase family protein [Pseudohoeflea suaedae]TDH37847.1 nucleotidyltransferase family protein [Pseudohoeflea suaedae]